MIIRHGNLLRGPHPSVQKLGTHGCLPGNPFRDGKATDFNGTNQYVHVANPSFKSNTQGAFSFWFRLATLLGANGSKSMIGYGVNSASNDSVLTILQRRSASTSNQNRLSNAYRPTNGGSTSIVNGGTALSATTTYHMVVQSTGSAWEYWLNAAAETLSVQAGSNSGGWLGNISGSDHRMTVGANWNSNAPVGYNDCRINDLAYFDRALTSTEVSWLYNSGARRNLFRASFRSALVSWWRMGDYRDSSGTIYDEKGGNHLTLVNMNTSNYVAP